MFSNLVSYCREFIYGTFLAWGWVKYICAGILSILYYALGDHSEAFTTIMYLIGIDFLMAMIVVAKTDVRLESAKILNTAYKIAICFLLVTAVQKAESIVHVNFGVEILLATIASGQVVSILEHARELGFIIPLPVLKNLKKISSNDK